MLKLMVGNMAPSVKRRQLDRFAGEHVNDAERDEQDSRNDRADNDTDPSRSGSKISIPTGR